MGKELACILILRMYDCISLDMTILTTEYIIYNTVDAEIFKGILFFEARINLEI